MVRLVVVTLVALFAAPVRPDDLGAFVEAQLREQGVPGASVVVIRANLVRLVRRPRASVAVLLAAIGVLIAIRDLPIPLPTMETGPANAASSLRATAPALAGFLIELSQPRTLNAAAVARMTRTSRTIDARSAWASASASSATREAATSGTGAVIPARRAS